MTNIVPPIPQINDIVGEFEQEKFEMQKQHTRNIQEILDDTNARLHKMEKEYSQQTTATVSHIICQSADHRHGESSFMPVSRRPPR